MTTPTTPDIRETIDSFLSDWDRHVWQQDHGEWASAEWDDERATYTAAGEQLRASLLAATPLPGATEEQADDYTVAVEALDDAMVEAGRLDDDSDIRSAARGLVGAAPAAITELDAILAAVAAVEQAARALDGQVQPDDQDYIATGTIDPDGVSDAADALGVSAQWQGWDCTEGWSAYRHGDALYMRWYRDAYGNRHDRDLWVRVDPRFFRSEAE